MRTRNIFAVACVAGLLPAAALAQGAGGAGPNSYQGPEYGGNNGQAAQSGTTPTRVAPGADGNEPTRDLGSVTGRNTTTSSADRASDADAADNGAAKAHHRYGKPHRAAAPDAGADPSSDRTPPH